MHNHLAGGFSAVKISFLPLDLRAEAVRVETGNEAILGHQRQFADGGWRKTEFQKKRKLSRCIPLAALLGSDAK